MAPQAHIADYTILLDFVPNISDIGHLADTISNGAYHTKKYLLIILTSPIFDPSRRLLSWQPLQRLLTFAYVQAARVVRDQDNFLLNVNVLLHCPGHSLQRVERLRIDWDQVLVPDSRVIGSTLVWQSVAIEFERLLPHYNFIEPDRDANTIKGFPSVALGGTFDHLHFGHKVLLSASAWIADKRIVVGVSEDSLLHDKPHREVLESLTTRMSSVHSFLEVFRSGLHYEIVPIHDVYGPTGWDPDIQALVVSKETFSGAQSIDTFRASKKLPPLQTFVIDVISASSYDLSAADAEELKRTKMSSTFIREWIVRKRVGYGK